MHQLSSHEHSYAICATETCCVGNLVTAQSEAPDHVLGDCWAPIAASSVRISRSPRLNTKSWMYIQCSLDLDLEVVEILCCLIPELIEGLNLLHNTKHTK